MDGTWRDRAWIQRNRALPSTPVPCAVSSEREGSWRGGMCGRVLIAQLTQACHSGAWMWFLQVTNPRPMKWERRARWMLKSRRGPEDLVQVRQRRAHCAQRQQAKRADVEKAYGEEKRVRSALEEKVETQIAEARRSRAGLAGPGATCAAAASPMCRHREDLRRGKAREERLGRRRWRRGCPAKGQKISCKCGRPGATCARQQAECADVEKAYGEEKCVGSALEEKMDAKVSQRARTYRASAVGPGAMCAEAAGQTDRFREGFRRGEPRHERQVAVKFHGALLATPLGQRVLWNCD